MPDQPLPTRPAHVLEEPSAKAVARVYAQAFLSAAASHGVEGAIEELETFVSDVLDKNSEFEQLLTGGVTNRDQKLGIIDRVVAGRASDLLANFLRVLARHERLEILPLVANLSRRLYEQQFGRRRVTVRSAAPLSNEQLNSIRYRVATALSTDPILTSEVDPSLMGGLVIQVGDTVHDGSLKTRIRALQHRLRERSIHEIQSGRDRFSSAEGN